MNAHAFHSKCDNKGATISIIKCHFNHSDKPCVIGGYLGESWNSTDKYISCSKSFIFSVTKKLKSSNNSSSTNAAYGYANNGPTFGSGHDIYITFNDGANYSCPASYKNTNDIIDKNNIDPNYDEEGMYYFKLLELEVYKI